MISKRIQVQHCHCILLQSNKNQHKHCHWLLLFSRLLVVNSMGCTDSYKNGAEFTYAANVPGIVWEWRQRRS